ncbi:hypothetical protein BJV78DRAFT_1209054 [Lactifluus subvellereus]|nr:hypothetical protein BJV78DRAFT_1209054 [Lactifluus subvellereus]
MSSHPLRKTGNQRSDAPSMTTTALVPTARNASSPAGLPFLALTSASVGTKGGNWKATVDVAPEAGVYTSKIESGSSVGEMPVSDAVTETSLSMKPDAAQALWKPVRMPTQWSVSLAHRQRNKKGNPQGVSVQKDKLNYQGKSRRARVPGTAGQGR